MQKRVLCLFVLFVISSILLPFSSFSQGWEWARSTAGTRMNGLAVSTDDSGDIFVGGSNLMISFAPATGMVTFGSGISVTSTPPLGVVSRLQAIWAKYDKNGNPLWADGTHNGDAHFFSSTTDPNGNLIVFGAFKSATVEIGPYVLTNTLAVGNWQYFLAKVSPGGTVLWAVKDGNVNWSQFGGVSVYLGRNGDVATDTAGNIYITSSFSSATMSVGPTVLVNTLTGRTDVFLAKYDPSGNPVWARSIGGSKDEFSYAVELSSTGDVYIAGSFNSPSLVVGPVLLTYTIIPPSPFGTYPLAYIAKFSPAGTALWAEKADADFASIGHGLAADNAGNIYMCGLFCQDSVRLGAVTIVNPVLGTANNCAFVVKFSAANLPLWGRTMWSPVSHAMSYDIAYNPKCDEVWTVGACDSALQIDGIEVPMHEHQTGQPPAFLAGFRGDGTFVEAVSIIDGGRDMIAVSCDKKGNTFVCSDYRILYGWFERFALGPDTLVGNGPLDSHNDCLFLAKYKRHKNIFLASRDTIMCASDSVVLDPGNGLEYHVWSDNTTSPSKTVYNAGRYWVSSWNDCGAMIITDTFRVLERDIENSISVKDTLVCLKDNVWLHPTSGFQSYVWNDNTSGEEYLAHDTGTYWVRSVRNCEHHVDSISVGLKDYSFRIAMPDSICIGLPVRLRLAIPPPDSATLVIWQPVQGIVDTTKANTAVLLDTPGTYKYNLTLGNAEGCKSSDSVAVRVLPPIDIFATPEEATISYGGSVQLEASQVFRSPETLFYTWIPNDGTLDNPNINHPMASPSVTTSYTVYAMDINGCRDTAMIKIKVDYLRECIPTSFTPNGDGLNDVFRLCSMHGEKLLDFSIYNRFGERVYQNTNDPKKGWDGYYKGEPQEIGVYFYMIVLAGPDGAQKVLKGDVTLLR